MTGTGAGTMDPGTLTATLRRIAHHHPEFLRTDAYTGAVVDLDWPAL